MQNRRPLTACSTKVVVLIRFIASDFLGVHRAPCRASLGSSIDHLPPSANSAAPWLWYWSLQTGLSLFYLLISQFHCLLWCWSLQTGLSLGILFLDCPHVFTTWWDQGLMLANKNTKQRCLTTFFAPFLLLQLHTKGLTNVVFPSCANLLASRALAFFRLCSNISFSRLRNPQ